MFKDYLIIDDVLINPKFFVDLSKKINYFYSENVASENDIKLESIFSQVPGGSWRGYRSKPLHQIDEVLFQITFNSIFSKIFDGYKFSYRYNIESYLHFYPEMVDRNDSSLWHKDNSSVFAGVIYLNENPPKNSGTILKIDGKEIEIENVYNRLALYNAQIIHKPANPFGKNMDDMRLTLTFFVENLSVSKSD